MRALRALWILEVFLLSQYHSVIEDDYLYLFRLAMKVGLSLSLNKAEAEDVAQDVLVALWVRSMSPSSPPIQDQVRWVATSARYSAIRVLKSRKRELPLLSRHASCQGIDDLKIDLAMAISRLSRHDQQLVALRYVYQLPIGRIATVVGGGETTIKRRLRRLRAVLIDAVLTVLVMMQVCWEALA